MLDPQASLALAEHVADVARRLGLDIALIGAAALAVHRYTRGTEDIGLAVSVDPHSRLLGLQAALDVEGLQTELRLPDDDDPPGGVLVVSLPSNDDDPADVIQLLARNSEADLDAVREAAAPFDRQGQLESLIEQAMLLRGRQR